MGCRTLYRNEHELSLVEIDLLLLCSFPFLFQLLLASAGAMCQIVGIQLETFFLGVIIGGRITSMACHLLNSSVS
jgi:hypothetical protein